ncbi:hypothetical protein [Desertibacillus haloalkaliphilus]|uniref:hypothetical protein n=1 Tax=Desertibacillus haloalkaliphilus TaxID=1328930 RepID=UPI001C26CC0B|nr:hypothetical protein [Desertibacillus haloalkaliphilus]MBU8908143.1 hypothetical protein [Desertibacillus haloalkaliphilus]
MIKKSIIGILVIATCIMALTTAYFAKQNIDLNNKITSIEERIMFQQLRSLMLSLDDIENELGKKDIDQTKLKDSLPKLEVISFMDEDVNRSYQVFIQTLNKNLNYITSDDHNLEKSSSLHDSIEDINIQLGEILYPQNTSFDTNNKHIIEIFENFVNDF